MSSTPQPQPPSNPVDVAKQAAKGSVEELKAKASAELETARAELAMASDNLVAAHNTRQKAYWKVTRLERTLASYVQLTECIDKAKVSDPHATETCVL